PTPFPYTPLFRSRTASRCCWTRSTPAIRPPASSSTTCPRTSRRTCWSSRAESSTSRRPSRWTDARHGGTAARMRNIRTIAVLAWSGCCAFDCRRSAGQAAERAAGSGSGPRVTCESSEWKVVRFRVELDHLALTRRSAVEASASGRGQPASPSAVDARQDHLARLPRVGLAAGGLHDRAHECTDRLHLPSPDLLDHVRVGGDRLVHRSFERSGVLDDLQAVGLHHLCRCPAPVDDPREHLPRELVVQLPAVDELLQLRDVLRRRQVR